MIWKLFLVPSKTWFWWPLQWKSMVLASAMESNIGRNWCEKHVLKQCHKKHENDTKMPPKWGSKYSQNRPGSDFFAIRNSFRRHQKRGGFRGGPGHARGDTRGGEHMVKGRYSESPWSLVTNKQLADIQQYNVQCYNSTRLCLQGHRVDKLSNSKANGDYMDDMIAC